MSYSSNIDIPSEIWCIIGSKLNSLEDRVHFRAVSKSWRSLIPPPPHPPCLVFNEDGHFMCLGKQEIYNLDFPEIHGARCIGSAGNCLITLHEDKTIRLTNLFSRAQTHLPHNGITTKGDRLRKLVFSSSSSSLWEGQNCSAMAIQDWDRQLVVVRPGDTSWTKVPSLEGRRDCIEDITFYKQKIYAVNTHGRLLVCDVGGDVNPPTLSCIGRLGDINNVDGYDEDQDEVSDDDDEYSFLYVKLDDDDPFDDTCYLVECSGELLAVVKFVEYFKDSDSRRVERVKWFKVYRFDFTSMEFIKMKSLGEHSLFIGCNGSCASVLASDYFGSVRKNCIYFFNSREKSYKVRVFDLEDKRYYKPMSTSFGSPPVWIVPA